MSIVIWERDKYRTSSLCILFCWLSNKNPLELKKKKKKNDIKSSDNNKSLRTFLHVPPSFDLENTKKNKKKQRGTDESTENYNNTSA